VLIFKETATTSKAPEHQDNQSVEYLLDLVYLEHQRLKAENEENNNRNLDSFCPSFSMLALRNYQIDAIRWMLEKEYSSNYSKTTWDQQQKLNERRLNPLYAQLTNNNNQTVYYQKYLGIFTDKKPEYIPCLPGGILADEMGLGKTLEVLGCIMMNPRNLSRHKIEDDVKRLQPDSKLKSFSCLCGNAPAVLTVNKVIFLHLNKLMSSSPVISNYSL
jgi:SNF2 family DNA or RNA helicase